MAVLQFLWRGKVKELGCVMGGWSGKMGLFCDGIVLIMNAAFLKASIFNPSAFVVLVLIVFILELAFAALLLCFSY